MSGNSEPEIIDLTGLTESSEEDNDEEGESSENSSSRGSSLEDEVTTNNLSRARLHDAIATIAESRLRQILQRLVDTNTAVEQALTAELTTLKRKTQDVVLRWDTCGNCDEEFDITTQRENGECVFHPGELELDEEQFEDWDETCHGPMDTSSNRIAYPDGFLWTCCDKNAISEGCVHGEHRSILLRKKRRI